MRMFLGGIIGLLLGVIVWFPFGIYYTVQATEPTTLMKIISTVKGLIEL